MSTTGGNQWFRGFNESRINVVDTQFSVSILAPLQGLWTETVCGWNIGFNWLSVYFCKWKAAELRIWPYVSTVCYWLLFYVRWQSGWLRQWVFILKEFWSTLNIRTLTPQLPSCACKVIRCIPYHHMKCVALWCMITLLTVCLNGSRDVFT